MAVQDLILLRDQINNDIKTNGVRAITGDILNTQLIDMIDSLESDYENQTTALDVRVSAIENLALKILQDPLTGWDASSGSFPGGGTAQLGYYWNVSVAGTVDGVEFDVGDSIVALVDNASTTTYSNNWFKEDNADRVLSVAGKIGNVTLDAADITDFDTEVANNTAVAANTLKVSNVTTDLSIGTATGTTLDINSSDGTNATIPSFNSTDAGLVPASGGGTTNFLRADGSWVALSLDNIYTSNGSLTGARTVTMSGNNLTFTGGKTDFIGANQDAGSAALQAKDSLNNVLFEVRNNGFIGINRGVLGPSYELDVSGIITSRTSGTSGNFLALTNSAGTSPLTAASQGLRIRNQNSGANVLAYQTYLIANGDALAHYGVQYPTQATADFFWNTGLLGGTERMRLTNDGNLGIGVNAPTAKLQVRGADLLSTSSALLVENSGGTDLFDVRNNGDITSLGVDDFSTFRYDGYIATRGDKVLHLGSNVHTFRADNNLNDRGCAVFMRSGGGVAFSIANSSVGVNMNAGLTESGISVKTAGSLERAYVWGGFDSTGVQTSRISGFGKLGLGNWGASQLTTVPVSTAAWVNVPASTVDEPHIRLESGVDVTSPLEGAIWKTASDLNFRIGGDTVKLYKETGVSAMTNVSAPVNLDADSVTVGELADIVGNLINKIQNLNLVGA